MESDNPTSEHSSETTTANVSWLRVFLLLGVILAFAAGVFSFLRTKQPRTMRSMNSCLNSLRLLDGAKAQWALENKKVDSDVVTLSDIAPYLKGSMLPKCPHYNGDRMTAEPIYEHTGTYSVTIVGKVPTCRCVGHTFSEL